jgi:hypothetical protein
MARRKIELLEEAEGENGISDAAIGRMTALLKLIERISILEQRERAAERARKSPKLVNDARRLELARRLQSLRRQLEIEGEQVQPEA